jgi:N-acetylglucosaminyl-diphospho-decaprenol L-rhamnosyltransferase
VSELSLVVVHWRAEADLARLVAAVPDDPRWEVVVVDNGSGAPLPPSRPPHLAVVRPGRNLGFAGGVNLGAAVARAPALLLLNPDAVPLPGALPSLLAGLAAFPDAAGLAPRLVGADGAPQAGWQLRPLPRPGELLLHALLRDPRRGAVAEPAAGAVVEQPAAAALLLRRAALEAVGGMDPRFHPAWFEDVDLARRLAAAGGTLRYWPAAEVRHGLGGSVGPLGYGPFLWCYYRNLCRYLEKHHGSGWALLARALLVAGVSARAALLPLARPRRASSRGAALAGLAGALLGALSGWRRPQRLAAGGPW